MATAEQLTAPDATHGEGPVWFDGWGGLRWVDMLAGDILHWDSDSGRVGRWHVGAVAACFRPRRSGGVVIAAERELLLAEKPGAATVSLGEPFAEAGIRFNDGDCDPLGNFLCGTMAYDEGVGRGAMYRLNVDHRVEPVFDTVTISNGLAWNPSRELAYYVDTPTRRIDVFDWDANAGLHNRRPFVRISGEGAPDGLTVDSEGGVWVALWGGSSVRRYTSEGALDHVIDVPALQVTACTFGGPNLDQLYITTSRQGRNPADDPTAGAIFVADVGVRGLPVTPFAG